MLHSNSIRLIAAGFFLLVGSAFLSAQSGGTGQNPAPQPGPQQPGQHPTGGQHPGGGPDRPNAKGKKPSPAPGGTPESRPHKPESRPHRKPGEATSRPKRSS